MNSENSKTSKPHVLILKLANKLDLRIDEKTIALSNLTIYYTYLLFEMPDGSYSVSDFQDFFEYIFKKHGQDINKPSLQIYLNKIENTVTFKVKNGHSLELLIPETMKLLGSTENNITKEITWKH